MLCPRTDEGCMSDASDAWYYAQQNRQLGPIPLEQLRRMLSAGHLQSQDLVWNAGMPSWVPAASVAQLADVIRPSVPNLGGGLAAAPGTRSGAWGAPAGASAAPPSYGSPPATSPMVGYYTPPEPAPS